MSEFPDIPVPDDARPYALYKVVMGRVVLAALVVLLAGWVGAPLLGTMALGGFLWSLRHVRKAPAVFKVGAIKAAIYGVAAVIAFFIQDAAQLDDRAQGDLLVGKLQQYKQSHNSYPEKLQELVPSLLPQIPRGRFSPFVFVDRKSVV